MNDIHNLIDAYFLRTISPEEEQFLFATLSADFEARKYFKERQIFNAAFLAANDPFPVELDQAILQAVAKKQKSFTVRTILQPGYIAAFSSVILFAFLFLFMLNRIDAYKYEIDGAMLEIKNQRQTIDLLMNSLPTVQVTSQGNNKVFIANN